MQLFDLPESPVLPADVETLLMVVTLRKPCQGPKDPTNTQDLIVSIDVQLCSTAWSVQATRLLRSNEDSAGVLCEQWCTVNTSSGAQ